MKTETKSWTPNHGDAYSPSQSQQTLCESGSGSFAVQSAPDCANTSDSLLSCQPKLRKGWKYCAKTNVVSIPLGRSGFCTLIDLKDAHRLYGSDLRPTLQRNTPHLHYADLYEGTARITSLHRFVLGLAPGDLRQCDHVNHDGLDNRRCNLRVCTHHKNQYNRRKQAGTVFKGVRYSPRNDKWTARIRHKKKDIHLGTFKTPEAAARAYDKKAKILFGKFACLNLPCPTERRAA